MANKVDSNPRYTKRLMLRPFRRRDASSFHEAVEASRTELQPWLPWIHGYDRGFAQRFIRESVASWAEGRAFDFAIRAMPDLDRHLGNVSIWPTSHQNRTGEIGYWIRSGETGRGYGTEAAAVALGVGFEELGMHKLVLRIAVGNAASERMAAKLGFTYEGILRDEVKIGPTWVDHSSWSLLHNEWAHRPSARGAEETYL
ncbi:MAG: GNAT family protein [Acidimicrobiia bacterium]